MIFHLDEPQILVGKGCHVETLGSGPSQYIEYTTGNKSEKTDEGFIAYPQEWRRRFGMNSLIRKRRNAAFAGITEEDILNPGVGTDNPMIGTIPNRDEVLRELEELLLSM